jgi:hypothetical protein
MGKLLFHYCPGCKYGEMSSGGPDRGFQRYTNTFVCLECQRLCDCTVPQPVANDNRSKQPSWLDRWLHFFRGEDTVYKEDLPQIIPYPLKVHRCESCGSKNLELWDSAKKECPKCKEKMLIEEKYPPIMWD